MKIVQINAVYEYSSTGRTTMEMHDYLKSNGHGSYVFCTNKHMPEINVYKMGCYSDYKMHSFMSHLTDGQGLYSHKSTKKLLRQLDDIHPDVVVLRNLHANYIHFPLLLRYLAVKDIATVIVLHDVWPFTGHCCYYTEDNCDKWMTECNNCPARAKYNKSWFLDNSKRNFQTKLELFKAIPRLAVVGVSKWVAGEARKSPIFANAKYIDYIYNWIDLKKFFPREDGSIRGKLNLNGRFVSLSVAQGWNELKGLFKIFEVAKKLPEDRFVLVGRMDYQGELPANVISVGATSNTDELAQYYSMADVLLVCSLQETFGKVSAEALSCGTPVIANNSTANPEIAGSECGIAYDTGNVDQIVSSIREIKSHGKSTYVDRCVNRAGTCFNFEIQIKKYMNLFEDMVTWGK
jgi:glycosyltransferase involved in cell wall biosynthesis